MMTGKRKSEVRNSKFETTKNSPKGSSTKLKTQNYKGFTLVEILTAVTIIVILIGILMPALGMVRKMAKDVQQKAQLASIEIGISLYKNENCFGDYPTSHGYTTGTAAAKYCGAQTLAEAMFGQDLLGVDPNTKYDADDTDNLYADANDRKGPYLDRTHINVFTAENVYDTSASAIEEELFLISDVYTQVRKNITLPSGSTRKVAVGTPILYYKADASKTTIDSSNPTDSVYNSEDNENLIKLGSVAKSKNYHHFDPDNYADGRQIFYEFIKDEMMTTNRPLRPDSFLLISAGYDGLYGTGDDICNFEPNIE